MEATTSYMCWVAIATREGRRRDIFSREEMGAQT
ncbi:uncharacterized protein G2W53_018567 [Senna tora]|uniref:Uncharacterized protein n=1 Tax=Senna tora TaxID=362788 RepID=A0A834WNG5_9FABA|nr:uncharacterized protein G2W53_018567 [Senna tora]